MIDSWSVRLASYRTADIVAIRRSADDTDGVGGHSTARSFPITAGGIEAPRLDAVLASA